MSEARWHEVIGISLIGPPPVGEIHIPWRKGINVLYGQNGAGMSRILEALLTFERKRDLDDGVAFLHIRYAPETRLTKKDRGSADRFGDVIANGATDRLAELAFDSHLNAWEDQIYFEEEYLEETLGGLIEAAVAVASGVPLSMQPIDDIDEEIFDSHVLSITPTDTIWASAILSEQTPLLRHGLANLTAGPSGQQYEGQYLPDGRLLAWPVKLTWPEWCPVPIVPIVREGHGLDLVRLNSASGDDPDDGATETAKSYLEMLTDVVGIEESKALEMLKDLLVRWSASASRQMKDLMINGPELMVELLPVTEWLEGRLVGWAAWDDFLNDWLPLFEMSTAQRKWADVAIYLGLLEVTDRLHPGETTALVIDEPEQALHPLAIEYLLQELDAAAHRLGGPVILASHSAQILGLEGAHLLHVTRDAAGQTILNELSDALSVDLEVTAERLGLRKSDLLQLYRVFLVVEGHHDSTVLESVFPGEWERNRIRLVHMMGSSHVLELAGSEILRDFTDAKVVVLLDDVDRSFVDGISVALNEAMDGRVTEAESILRSIESKAGAAERLTVELARSFFKQPGSINIRGMHEKDIIEYLDPTAFGLTNDWNQLRLQYRDDRRKEADFKEWLRRTHGARINLNTIRSAAEVASDHPPADLVDVLQFCTELSVGRPQEWPTAGGEEEE